MRIFLSAIKPMGQKPDTTGPITPHATIVIGTPGCATGVPCAPWSTTTDLPNSESSPSRYTPAMRTTMVSVPSPTGWPVAMSPIDSRVLPAGTHGGPAENALGDEQLPLVCTTTRNRPPYARLTTWATIATPFLVDMNLTDPV